MEVSDNIIELIFYGLADYIVYIPLVFFPFRKRLRHSKALSYFAMIIIAFGFSIMSVGLANGFPPWLVPVVSVVAAIGVMYWGLNVHMGKSLMVLLTEYCSASFIAVMAKNVEMFVFPERIHTLYKWTHSLFIIIGVIFVVLFDSFVSWRILDPIINTTHKSSAWNYIWITPLSFFVVWFIYVYSSNSYNNAEPESPIILGMLIFLEIGSVITYFILLRLLHFENEKSRLEYQEAMNQAQYKNLSQRIDEARKSRHDIRHHLLILDSLAKEENIQGIRDYLNQISDKQANENVLAYCDHFATNALLSYYYQQAAEEGMEYSVKCNIPSEIGVSDKDLTIVFGNLLENAMNACRKIHNGKKMIQVVGRYEDSGLTLMIENTSVSAPKRDKNGRYLSSSHSGYGVGIESVQTIVKKYNGIMTMEFEDQIVTVTILLMI